MMAAASDVLAVMGAKPTPVPGYKPEILPPSVWGGIRDEIEKDIRTAPRELQKTIGPSELGTDCLHCLAAKLAGWRRSGVRSAAWLPFIGTCVHEHMERLFTRLDPRLYRTEMKVSVGEIRGLEGGYEVCGSIDLWDRLTASTVDWKIVGATTLKGVKAHGPSQLYIVQASLYGIGLTRMGDVPERSCIYFLPRNAPSLADALPVEMRFDPAPGQWALDRANRLAKTMDQIEKAAGVGMRDAWIHGLPTSPSHCWDCGSWPDDRVAGLAPDYPPVPPQYAELYHLFAGIMPARKK